MANLRFPSLENVVGEAVVIFSVAWLFAEDSAREVHDVVDAADLAPRVTLTFLQPELDTTVVIFGGHVLRDLRDLRDHVHLVVVEQHLHVFGQLLHVEEQLVYDVELLHGWLSCLRRASREGRASHRGECVKVLDLVGLLRLLTIVSKLAVILQHRETLISIDAVVLEVNNELADIDTILVQRMVVQALSQLGLNLFLVLKKESNVNSLAVGQEQKAHYLLILLGHVLGYLHQGLLDVLGTR